MYTKAWLLQFRNQGFGFLREPVAFVCNLLVPLFIVTTQALAFGDTEIDPTGLPGMRVVDTLPAMAGTMFVIIIGLFGAGVGLASLIEERTLAGSSLRPGGTFLITSAYAVVLLALMVVGLCLATLILFLGWHIRPAAHPFLLSAVLFLSAAGFLSLGTLIASLVGSPRSAQGVCSACFFPFLFLSGAVFPVDTFPLALQVFSKLLPGYHVSQLAYAAWLPDQVFPWRSLWYVAVFAVLATMGTWLVVRHREAF